MYGVDRQYQNLKHEVLDITDRILSTGQVLDGACTTAFELEIAQRCHRRYAVTVNSATQGLIFALRTAPLVEKSGVLIPAVSFIAALNAALTFPGNIRMCDIDHTALMDLSTVEDPLRDQINVIMYANLFGNTVDWDRFQIMADFFSSSKMFVIEDAAQSFGASFNGVPSGTIAPSTFAPLQR
jgi:UDP-2-acetamido-2-deoxy-ribo-hexuluronate aminotransferase